MQNNKLIFAVLLGVILVGGLAIGGIVFLESDTPDPITSIDEPAEFPDLPDENFTGEANNIYQKITAFGGTSWKKDAYYQTYSNIHQEIRNFKDAGRIDRDEASSLNGGLDVAFSRGIKTFVEAYFETGSPDATFANPLKKDMEAYQRKASERRKDLVAPYLTAIKNFQWLLSAAGNVDRFIREEGTEEQRGVDLLGKLDAAAATPMLAESPYVQRTRKEKKERLKKHFVAVLTDEYTENFTKYFREETYSASRNAELAQAVTRLRNHRIAGEDAKLIAFIERMNTELTEFKDFDEISTYRFERGQENSCQDICGKYQAYVSVCDTVRARLITQ